MYIQEKALEEYMYYRPLSGANQKEENKYII